MDRIAVMIPCYNEEATIAKVVNDFQRVLPDAQIFVFDNASDDNTALEAKRAGAIVYNVPKRGKGHVIRTMFEKIDADIYVLVDGDDTYPAHHAPELIAKVPDGYDMVVGDRFLDGSYYTQDYTYMRSFGNRLVKRLIQLLYGADLSDILSGYRAFSRRFVKSCRIKSNGFDVETELTICAINKNFKICQIPISYKDRPFGSTSKIRVYRDGVTILIRLLLCYGGYVARKVLSYGKN